VLRYRLYDVELIISRGLLVAGAAAFAAVGYVGLVVALGRAAGHRTGGFWASLVAMTVVALAFQPLRKAVVRLADRLAYGARAAPYDALATFSRRIGRSPAPGAVLPAIAAAAGQTVAAERVLVRLDVAGGADVVETWPTGQETRVPSGPTVPIADEHGPLGSITIDLPAGRDLRPFEEGMLSDIADQAAVAFRNVRLQVELAARVEQLDERARALTASRRRIIEAADTERPRLEAALAREVLPAMTALRRDLLVVDEGLAEPTVARYVDRATGALEALRELTRGIYPTLLTRSGLAAALTAFADRRGLTGRVSLDPEVAGSRYSDRVEAAAYFCCLEALADVRPAASIGVEQVGDRLVVTIRGSQIEGLDRLGMSDRVEAAEGRLDESGDLLTIDLPALTVETSPRARPPAGARG
jgi:GAF domain-containing protein